MRKPFPGSPLPLPLLIANHGKYFLGFVCRKYFEG